MIYLLLISMLLYAGMLLWFITGNMFSDPKPVTTANPPVSVVVAIRNGESTLSQLILDLESQDYSGRMEFILVDDLSEDSTSKLIHDKASRDNRFKYESSSSGDSRLNYKKRALDAGIRIACNEWLLFTDVDCRLNPAWVRGMVAYFRNDVDYVIGFSEIDVGNKLVTRFQSLDYLMLMISARGSTRIGRAWASSGQNQAYRRSLFDKVNGFSEIADKIQGDDSLFLQLCRKHDCTQIAFADEYECRTISQQEHSWKTLFIQRLRWSGDARMMWQFNRVFFIFIMAAFLMPFLLILTFLFGIFYNYYYLTVFIKFLTIHFILEFILYFVGTRQLSKPIHFFNFSIWFLIHIPYIVIMGMGSFYSNQLQWRGR